jgi:FixJ family two-component response regulator
MDESTPDLGPPRPLQGRVAIVDDDASVRRALARILGAAGLHVETFGSALEYLAARKSGPPACVVLDVHLGGMTGFELHDHLVALGADERIIFITAHEDVSSSDLARHAGGGGYLRKPFDGDSLLALVRQALSVPDRE